MGDTQVKARYLRLAIVTSSSKTQIWLGDHNGYLVQRAVGKLSIELLPGNYVVEFGLGTPAYPIQLNEDLLITQAELVAKPTCAPPLFSLLE